MYLIGRLLLIILLVGSQFRVLATPNSKGVIPDTLVLEQRWSYNQYTHLVIPTIDWLQNTPLDSNNELRRRHDNFLMFWLQKNEDVTVNMPEYLLKFQNAHRELYFIYAGGWIKFALETGNRDFRDCAIAAVSGVLNFYKEDMGVPDNEYLNHLVKLQEQGKIPALFDSSATAANTYIFLNPPSDKHDFRADENYFNFRYTGINFTNTKALRYRYRLQGYYDDWITTGEETVTFPKLPSGNYTFTVQASIYPDFAHAVEDSYTFSIATPFYKQPWFVAVVVLMIVSVVWLYMRYREQSLRHLATLEQERVVFEYEYLKSQVNPHFLFNSLNTLTSLIEDNPEKAISYTARLSDLYRNMLAHRHRNLVTLAEELEILGNYIHIQKSRFGDALQIKQDISQAVLSEKKIVYLALQLLVENAIKHNIVSQSQPLIITIAVKQQELVVSNPMQPKMSKEKSNGMGLANISKRYALATNRPISFGEEKGQYVVRLPLL